MPRRSGGGGRAPSRPTVSRPAPPPPTKQQQSRPNATYAAPAQQAGQTAQGSQAGQSQSPGLFGQMASTAAGVAIGSSIGHAVGGMFGGYGSQQADPVSQGQTNATAQQGQAYEDNCAGAAKQFTKCMDDQGGNMQICNWYLEQLKACQAAASPY